MMKLEEFKEFDKLKTKVLKYVLYKKRTEYEVRQKFSDIETDKLEAVIENLKELGYINDKEYIKKAVLEFMALKNLSLKEIKYKLYSKGLERNVLEDYFILNEEELKEYETKSAQNIFLKKNNSVEKKEIIEYLLKKGYNISNINEAIDNINDFKNENM